MKRRESHEWLTVYRPRLKAVGVPLGPEELHPDGRGLIVEQATGPEPVLLDLGMGGIGVVFPILVTTDLPLVTICDIDCVLPWEGRSFHWFDDPHEVVPEREEYRFSNGLSYPRELVINHRLLPDRELRRGQLRRGFLLGDRLEEMPEAYRQGTSVPVELTFFDQGSGRYRIRFQARIDRRYRQIDKSLKRRSREGLFAGDPRPASPTDIGTPGGTTGNESRYDLNHLDTVRLKRRLDESKHPVVQLSGRTRLFNEGRTREVDTTL